MCSREQVDSFVLERLDCGCLVGIVDGTDELPVLGRFDRGSGESANGSSP
jgi:hypothetical protein